MKWITASDLANWANTQQRHCQSTLPELIGRLILAHAGNAMEDFDFPSGDSVTTGGWDGRLNTPIISPFFPSGASGWEMGATKSAQSKADSDYSTRTKDPLGLNPKESTFVFVTPRPFPKRSAWVKAKKAKKKWKDIRVVAADALEQWISISPAVGLWFARQIGKVVSDNVRDIEAVWDEWSIGTMPQMTPELVIAGRTSDAEEIKKWIDGNPSIKEVQGDHPDESLAFLYASIATLPETEKAKALSRCVVVESKNDLRTLVQAFPSYPLIIAAPGDCLSIAPSAVAKGHHVFISMDATVVGIRTIQQLARPQRHVVETLLKKSGLSEAAAEKFARDSGRSIPVLRRQMFQSNAVNAPSWARAENARVLLPAFLANAWDEEKEGDRKVIEKLTGKKYKDFVSELDPFLTMDDAPLRKVGSVWMIKSPLDAWFLLGGHLSKDNLNNFEQALISVLSKTDPKYDLEPEKRWAAAIYGKSNPYSDWLQVGLVESLTLMSVFASRSPSILSTSQFADRIVKSTFKNFDKWEAWASTKGSLPLLAEASPDEFFSVVEQWILKDPNLFVSLMSDGGGLFGECRHSGLLWAMEGLAWSKEHFARAIKVLEKLADIDPGGGWSNRPINTLSEIFHPELPQTHATPESRIEVLKELASRNPKLAWRFTQNYFGGGTMTETHRLRWRETGGSRRGLEEESAAERSAYVTGLLPIMEELVCCLPNVADAFDSFIKMPDKIRKKLITFAKCLDEDKMPATTRTLLLRNIRRALHWITSYGEKDIRKHAKPLKTLLNKFAPTNVLDRVGWILATPWPDLPYEPEDYNDKEAAVRKAQTKAAREILDQISIEKIVEFARTVQYQGVLGHALALAVKNSQEDNFIKNALYPLIEEMPLLVKGYIVGRIEITSEGWIDRELKRLEKTGDYTPEVCGFLYLGLPESKEVWKAVEKRGELADAAYWKGASGYSRSDKKADAEFAVRKLLDAKRPAAALQIAGDPSMDLPSELLRRLLGDLLGSVKAIGGAMDDFHVGHVFRQLFQRGELSTEEIAALEWPYALLLDDIRQYTGLPAALHKLLANNPQFFAQLIGFKYKRDDHRRDADEKKIAKKHSKNRWEASSKILDSWSLLPGTNPDGTINETELREWVDAARKACAEKVRTIGGDIQIGFLLAHAPADQDGNWPCIPVRNVIESLDGEIVTEHIATELYNNRGVVSRGLGEGGKQERSLAEKYRGMADSMSAKWPRTASLLRGMASTYSDHAKGVDIQADLQDLSWD